MCEPAGRRFRSVTVELFQACKLYVLYSNVLCVPSIQGAPSCFCAVPRPPLEGPIEEETAPPPPEEETSPPGPEEPAEAGNDPWEQSAPDEPS